MGSGLPLFGHSDFSSREERRHPGTGPIGKDLHVERTEGVEAGVGSTVLDGLRFPGMASPQPTGTSLLVFHDVPGPRRPGAKVDVCAQKVMLTSQPLEPVHVTSLGDRVSVDGTPLRSH